MFRFLVVRFVWSYDLIDFFQPKIVILSSGIGDGEGRSDLDANQPIRRSRDYQNQPIRTTCAKACSTL